MSLDHSRQVSIGKLILVAQSLKSDEGSNPEYDRALVELITDAINVSTDFKHEVAKAIGIKLKLPRKNASMEQE